jgi:hypothetical protein
MGIDFGAKVIELVGSILPSAFFFAILWEQGKMYRNVSAHESALVR